MLVVGTWDWNQVESEPVMSGRESIVGRECVVWTVGGWIPAPLHVDCVNWASYRKSLSLFSHRVAQLLCGSKDSKQCK